MKKLKIAGTILKNNSILLLFIILCPFLAGYQSRQDSIEETEEIEHVTEEFPYVDYDHIEQYHKILFHNITESPLDDFDNTVLAEYLKEDTEKDKELIGAGSGEEQPLTIDYHLFDFNDDGLEDYLVCMQGTFWSQEDKNIIRIYIQEQDGTLQEVFEDYTYFSVCEQPVVTILSDREEGYHLLAIPGRRSLLRYDKESGRYEFCEVEGYIEEDIMEDEIHSSITEEEYTRRKKAYKEQVHADEKPYIDYDFIEKKHQILKHNICCLRKVDYNNTILKEYLQEDIERDKEAYERGIIAVPLAIDYFPFDFNGDGLEDYLVCYYGSLWCGSGGNSIRILVQEEKGSLKQVLRLTVRLHEENMPYEHAAVAVLDEKTDGYYAIVLPGSNRILRYDKEMEKYVFSENEY
ncbi:MAG: hypothetical protein NC489_22500 [Ruminococcus flavefaciens]|nr:hypothetical protein [Ruminococcus flavefaciens]